MNKLYEEAHIQDIARAIREKNGSSDTYTVSQMGNAVREIQAGTPTEENRKVITGTITETVVGSSKYVVLSKDSKLAEIRKEVNLLVRVEFDIAPTAYTIIKSWATNVIARMPVDTTVNFQYIQRCGSNGSFNYGSATVPINTDSPLGVGCVQITEDGELRIYSNSSSNYAIRPSNYKVVVEW